MTRCTLAVVAISSLLAACGSDDAGSDTAQKAPARAKDCEMTAAAALRVHRLLSGAPAPARPLAGLVLHRGSRDETLTRNDNSRIRRRDVFVLVNQQDRDVMGMKATTGALSVMLTARPGCGAVGSLSHRKPYRVDFFENGMPAGGTSAGRR